MAKAAKMIYVVYDGDDGTPLVCDTMEDAWHSSPCGSDEAAIVEVYKLVRKVSVTRTESYIEREVE